ncbi:hypothetical protein N7532_007841 [Penicillium argentinense]|uniref:RNA 3'-terminal phosphate cyclase domain-containing protein n=1 Tax=Penicillium argentinense TaxID=1131581 RepID=A0A9W9EW76_9EURO|nr:uncharacterized protein N7532_007841 [Penicillium argentinense]KAJ5089157.1 hypothetical protein N7532_007841 [Penicillium argentinense]
MATSRSATNTIGAASPQRSPRHVKLDGRTLEGGGQLVRNALALSALTSQPITVEHVCGNRGGKTGLKASHAAAVKLVGDISRSKVTSGQVGSQGVTFEPPCSSNADGEESLLREDGPLHSPNAIAGDSAARLVSLTRRKLCSEYNIRLPTPGSALYPYLLWAGSHTSTPSIKVNIIGGTNGTNSPSYDYAAQVMVPNFQKLGLPPLYVALHKRGWTTGVVSMGFVTFHIHPLQSCEQTRNIGTALPKFPRINIMDYDRGKITSIRITVLALDALLPGTTIGEQLQTVRQFAERHTRRTLRKALKTLDASLFDQDYWNSGRKVPIEIHTSEATTNVSRFYILLVACTSEASG